MENINDLFLLIIFKSIAICLLIVLLHKTIRKYFEKRKNNTYEITLLMLIFYLSYLITFILSLMSSINIIYPFDYNIPIKEYATIFLAALASLAIFEFTIKVFYSKNPLKRIFRRIECIIGLFALMGLIYGLTVTINKASIKPLVTFFALFLIIIYFSLIFGWSYLYLKIKREPIDSDYPRFIAIGHAFVVFFIAMVFIICDVLLMESHHTIFAYLAWILYSIAFMRFYQSLN